MSVRVSRPKYSSISLSLIVTLPAVSYTHLVLFVLTDGEVVGLLCLQRVKHQVHGVLAVSYTHLDVYKRQGVLYRFGIG